MKDAYYFPHDSNARMDIRIVELRVKHGWSGYGIYWGIIEVLRDQDSYRFEANKKHLLSTCLGCAYADLEPVLDTCVEVGLLHEENGYIFSPSLTRRMERMDEIREKRRLAGAKGGSIKQSPSGAKANAKQVLSIKGKESKGKESKEDKKKEKKSTEDKKRDEMVETLFEKQFWPNYPRRDAKVNAFQAFKKVFDYPVPSEQCNERFKNMGIRIAQLIAEKRDRKHIPLPATFLNAEDFDSAPDPIETDEIEFVEIEEVEV